MSGSGRRIAAVVLRQYFLISRDPTRFLPLVIWSSIDMVLWGFISRYLNGSTVHTLNFVPVFLGGILFWDYMIRVMWGVSMGCMEDIWSHNFLNVFASPLAVWEYVAGLVVSSILTSLVSLAAMLALASGVFGLHILGYGLPLVPFILILFMTGVALGIVGCGLMLRLGPAAEWFVWPIPALLSPFVGVFYPLTILPRWMQAVAHILPPSYIFENIRRIAAGNSPVWRDLLIGAGLSALYIAMASLFFTSVYRHATRNGLITRYSAEIG